ncbi:MAG TPA: toll/interleukin-1 receptor domain-containing protein [Accumulibacter sp.]|uniref:toll/interleukin-1 receptor domain-containing protein n=1 Tax=Accumulibacter sp. TaxID=2053492 RepID=UPI002610E506|nr:toll/interleukin-1 receptor domain-containing protein [Accumulibacter sp.]HRF74080.1 toll/interleukin-1 receptor domain-containing protein [Accumulibacter sp.]
MSKSRRKFVLVIGTGWATPARRRVARMIGATLVDCGFGLLTGNSTGIDYWVSDAFCAALRERGESPQDTFRQVSLGWTRLFRRGGLPLPGYSATAECRVPAADVEAWKREAIGRCDAAVMVGGGRGALDIARRVIEQGKPVFPLPFMGGLTGNSDYVFQEILKTWDGHPVPGVSRSQFLRLAEPWVSGTGQLRNLLRGTLAETPDVFISYRRSDAPAAAGRVANDLAEHFGARRVFLDVSGIAPSSAWDESIEGALRACAAGVIVIGRSWLVPAADGLPPRLHDRDDVVRSEIASLIEQRRAIFPVLVEGARLPDEAELPEPLRALLRFQATTIDNGGWGATMNLLVREIETVIRHHDDTRRAATSGAATGPAPAAVGQGDPRPAAELFRSGTT